MAAVKRRTALVSKAQKSANSAGRNFRHKGRPTDFHLKEGPSPGKGNAEGGIAYSSQL